MSPPFGAILGFVLGQDFTTPQLQSLAVTSDGFLVSGNYFLGSFDEFEETLNQCLDAEALFIPMGTKEAFWAIFKKRVGDFRVKY